MLIYKSNFIIHYIELKYRTLYFFLGIIIVFFLFFLYKVELFYIIAKSFLLLENGFIYTGLLDPLIIYLKLTILSSIIFTLPLLIYLYGFYFFRAFYNYQTIYWFFFFFSFYISGFLIYSVLSNILLPIFFKFLLEYQRPEALSIFSLKLAATINQYFILYTTILSIYFLIVLGPIFFLFLSIFNLIDKNLLLQFSFRKYLYIIVYSFFIIIMPPDIFIQVVLLPLILIILEIYIYLVVYFFVLYSLLSSNSKKLEWPSG